MMMRKFFVPNHQPNAQQMRALVHEYSTYHERLPLNEIAQRMEVTPGTACVLRLWHLQGAA